jgi:hypothetical protein
MGLGTQWVTIHIEDPFKRLLGIPDLITCYSIIPVGYPAAVPSRGSRRPLGEMTHYEKYDPGKQMSNQQILGYIEGLRSGAREHYPEQDKTS